MQNLKLECTIADLARSEEIQSAHIVEALQYKTKLEFNFSLLTLILDFAIMLSFT
jgi:hypothetical protein